MRSSLRGPFASHSPTFVLLSLFAACVPAFGQTLHVDIHAHPSRFHRAAVPAISEEEVQRYLAGGMHVVVCNVSTDTPYRGGYVEPDGREIPTGQRRPEPGEVWAYTLDRLGRLDATAARDDATFVRNPEEARAAASAGKLGLIPALEGADALEGKLERLEELHRRGLGLIQLVHFRANEIGHIQTWPYTPGGLTEFGRSVVRAANRLKIVIDLAHANSETIRDTLAVSAHPVIFSHTGVLALREGDRYLGDDDIRAIAGEGGVIGIWPNGSGLPSVDDMARHIAYIRDLVGIEHVAIGSDLRGMGSYSEGFGEEANFRGIADALRRHGFAAREIDLVMGGNFMRVWEAVAARDDDGPFDPERQLLEAAKRGDSTAMAELCQRRESLEARHEMGRTPLMLASAEGHLDVVSFRHRGAHRLACYLMRSPVNLSRLRYHPGSQLILYEPKAGHDVDDETALDPLEFLARALIHVPEPNKHLVHFYGAYANRVRSTYRKEDTAHPPKRKPRFRSALSTSAGPSSSTVSTRSTL